MRVVMTPAFHHAQAESFLDAPLVFASHVVVVVCSRTSLASPHKQRRVDQRQRASATFLPSNTIVQVSQPEVPGPSGVFVNPDTTHSLPAISCMLTNRVSLPVLPPSSDTACQFITTLPHGEHAATLRNGTLARIRACVLPPSGSFSGSTLRIRRRQ